eukprot:TRINITY_DN100662_c0_g1_i1.p1 TRINITY_DN100662_c0_g1~~TRINITY_DN100662_c0_g1_i1.p1  ORF type:complete len:810 (-),score=111.36 TRINITY_DN100662_c0_g1_i1:320-2749(-)
MPPGLLPCDPSHTPDRRQRLRILSLSLTGVALGCGISFVHVSRLSLGASTFRNPAEVGRSSSAASPSRTPRRVALRSSASADAGHWLGKSVYVARLGGGLSKQLAELCLQLEASDKTGRVISNRGGSWQSKDLVGRGGDTMEVFCERLHAPLAEFLQGAEGSEASDVTGSVRAVPDQMWANVNRDGAWNARHTHGSPTVSLRASCVYYPCGSSEEAGKLRLWPKGEDPVQIEPQEDRIVLFPPDVPHEVEPGRNGGSQSRLSFAMNLRTRWLQHPLFVAASDGDPERVSELVAVDGVDVRSSDGLGLQAMHFAAERGHVPVVDRLLELQADPASISEEGWSPLGLAAERGHAAIVQRLVAEKAFGRALPPQEGVKHTGRAGITGALEAAADKGHMGVVELLASGGGQTDALALAAGAGHVPVVRFLLGRGESPDGTGGRKPILQATTRSQPEVVRLLVDAGADLSVPDETGRAACSLAAEAGHIPVIDSIVSAPRDRFDPDQATKDGSTALHFASQNGHLEAVEKLVTAGAGMGKSAVGASPGLPIHWATAEGHEAVASRLVELGCDVNGRAEGKGASKQGGGLTGLAAIASAGVSVFSRRGSDAFVRIQAAEVLSRRGIASEAATEVGGTALHVAAREGHVPLATALLKLGADVLASDDDGGQPLHWASAAGRVDVLTLLIEKGAECSAVDKAGSTALHDAAWGGHAEAATLLLDAPEGHLQLDAVDGARRTALHAAASLGQDDIIELLLARGSQAAHAGDDSGRSPFDLAEAALNLIKKLPATSKYREAMMAKAERVYRLLSEPTEA